MGRKHTLLFLNSGVGSFTSHKNKSVKVLRTGPTVFRPYPRRLESLTICRCHCKGSTFSSVILRPWVLVWRGFETTTCRSADPDSYPVATYYLFSQRLLGRREKLWRVFLPSFPWCTANSLNPSHKSQRMQRIDWVRVCSRPALSQLS